MSIWNVLFVNENLQQSSKYYHLILLFLTYPAHTGLYRIDFKDSSLSAAGQEQFNSIIN